MACCITSRPCILPRGLYLSLVYAFALLQNPVPQPIYLLKPESNKTMTANAYFPKGSWWNEKKRNWTKIETWKPPGHVSGKLPPQA